MNLAFAAQLNRPDYLPDSIVAQLVSVSAFSHSLDPKATWALRCRLAPDLPAIDRYGPPDRLGRPERLPSPAFQDALGRARRGVDRIETQASSFFLDGLNERRPDSFTLMVLTDEHGPPLLTGVGLLQGRNN